MNNKIFSTFNNNFSQIIIIDYLFTQTFTFKKIVQEKKKKNSIEPLRRQFSKFYLCRNIRRK